MWLGRHKTMMKKIIQCLLLILCLAVIFTALFILNISGSRGIVRTMESNFQYIGDGTLSPPYKWFATSLHETQPLKPECRNIIPAQSEKLINSHQAPSVNNTQKIADSLYLGGEYLPDNCDNPDHVAIIVPYRDRAEQLPVFLGHIHPFLMVQNIHYRIYLVNQADDNQFNRAALMNAGFKESLKDFNWTCFIFHDVDHLPEDGRNLYSCPDQPRHMAVAIDKWNYKMPYHGYFGGIVALRREHYEQINGVSNEFWGWGAEDDDMRMRIVKQGMKITRYDPRIARYTTIKHKKAAKNPDRRKILKESNKGSETDGLSNVSYTILSFEEKALYSNMTVNLHKSIETISF